MGCDYYFWIDTVIQYTDSANIMHTYIEGTPPRRAYNMYPRDQDFEVVIGLNDEIEIYGKKTMFEDSVWYCLDVGQLRIQKICYNKKIPIDSLVSVFKFKNGYNV